MRSFLTLFYRHPSGSINKFINTLESILNEKHFLKPDVNYVFCGDININLLEKSTKVHNYKHLIESFDLTFHTHSATRIYKDSETCIDHVFAKIFKPTIVTTEIKDHKISDHNVITIKISNINVINKNNSFIPMRSYNNESIDQFRTALQNISWDMYIKQENDINTNTNSFLGIVLKLHDEHFPIKQINGTIKKPGWFSKTTGAMLSHKNFLSRKSRRTGKIADKIKLQNYCKLLKQHIHSQKKFYLQLT